MYSGKLGRTNNFRKGASGDDTLFHLRSIIRMASGASTSTDFTKLLQAGLPSVKSDLHVALSKVMDFNDMPREVSDRVSEYYKACLDYNLVGGKLTRARIVCEAVWACRGGDLTENSNELNAALVLGWAVEILQAFFLIEDDVMDNGETRRGRPCWFRVPTIGVANAINDGLLLEQLLYRLIESNEYTKAYSIPACAILRDAAMRTVLGQHLDTSPPDSVTQFTREQWLSVVRFKTAFYTFILPVELGILVSGRTFTGEDLRAVRRVNLMIGELFQAQDDILDCFGDPTVIGKIGRDIEEGKCTWLLYTALAETRTLASDTYQELVDLFSSPRSPTSVQRVKSIYKDIQIESLFESFTTDLNTEINSTIDSISSAELQDLCRWIHATTHKRQK
jgi:farnesyl diphosphate synthase